VRPREKGLHGARVCGKSEELAKRRIILIYTLGASRDRRTRKLDAGKLGGVNCEVLNSLFMTITNANFDEEAIENQIRKMLSVRDTLRKMSRARVARTTQQYLQFPPGSLCWRSGGCGGALHTERGHPFPETNDRLRVKGMAAYAEHAKNLGKEDPGIYAFIYEALWPRPSPTASPPTIWSRSLMRTGEHGVKVMALLDDGQHLEVWPPGDYRGRYRRTGNPAILNLMATTSRSGAAPGTTKGRAWTSILTARCCLPTITPLS
jgi:hydroxylamine reductase